MNERDWRTGVSNLNTSGLTGFAKTAHLIMDQTHEGTIQICTFFFSVKLNLESLILSYVSQDSLIKYWP